jgi:tellurite resistance protein
MDRSMIPAGIRLVSSKRGDTADRGAPSPTDAPQFRVSASLFGMVLGVWGLGQSWRLAASLWQTPEMAAVGKTLLAGAMLLWVGLLAAYIVRALRNPSLTAQEFKHPVEGGTPALLGIATFLTAQTALLWSRDLAWVLTIAGLAWHMGFALWHTGIMWKGERASHDTTPALYLPTVAANFTAAGALGALGQTDWAWLFMGWGILSWLALEPLVIRRLWHGDVLPAAQRPLLGIQFAPPVVCATALLVIAPGMSPQWILMLLGYALFQMLVGLRLWSWMTSRPFAISWWAYTFGVVSATVACLKLALVGVTPAHDMAIPVFIATNVFLLYLGVKTIAQIANSMVQPRALNTVRSR